MSKVLTLLDDLSADYENLQCRADETKDKVEEVGTCMSLVNSRLDQLLHLMKDMVQLESHIDEVEERILSRLDKLAASQVDSGKLVDRLIEMSMVNRGQSQDAVIHRSQARIESNFSDQNAWTEEDETPEDVWPPPGCDAMDVRG